MPINFNLLRQSGPTNLYEGFTQGQEEVRANAMAQQKATQDQEMNALRMQQVRNTIGQQEREVKSQAAAQKTGMFRERLLRARTPDDARNIVRMQYADPDLSPVLSQAGTLEQALAEIPDDPTELRRYIEQEAVGMGDWLKLQMKARMPMNVGNAVYIPDTDSFRTPPRESKELTPPASVAEYTLAQKDPNFMRFLQDRAAATRAPVNGTRGAGGGGAMPKAPPGYRYTPTGDLEAIPGGPAAVKQGEAQSKQETGRTQAFDILDSLSDAYSELDRMKAIPSQQRGALSNVLSSVAASPVGQVAGRATGTEAQTQRDIASSARLQLLAAVKNATGLSSQQLNSNVEFTTWLNSLTDPARGIETNKTILENMRRFIDSGGTYSAKQGGKAAQPASGRPEGVGADWTLMTDKNNNRAWVSPDRKSFKEVK